MLRIKNWQDLQHFKDRTPPWIKLYRNILDQRDIMMISDSSFRVLIGVWLLASEDKDMEGKLPCIEDIAFRLCKTEKEITKAIQELKGFIIDDDIKPISSRYQVDAPETETETYNKETYNKETETTCPFNIDLFLDDKTRALVKKDAPGLDLNGYIIPAYKVMIKTKSPPTNPVGSLRAFARKCYSDYKKEHGV